MENRSIKFRQKTLDKNGNKAFHYWGFMDNGSFMSPIQSNNGTYWTALSNSEQDAGLHDKNGKEIYEGDIMCHTKADGTQVIKGFVEYVNAGYKLVRKELNTTWPLLGYSKNCEVIGNVWETPELLKESAS